MKILKIIPILLVSLLVSCKEVVYNDDYNYTVNDRTVKFLDRADRDLKPCLDSIKNSNSTDISIMSNCHTAVFLYRKYGGHDHLAPLYLTVIKKHDILRAKQLVDNLDNINEKFIEVEKRNESNIYYQQISTSQKIAQSAAEFAKVQVGEE